MKFINKEANTFNQGDENSYFLDHYFKDSIYDPEAIFVVDCFYNFSYRYNSLYRYWLYNKENVKTHLKRLSKTPGCGTAESFDFFSETAEVDIEYFTDFLHLSALSFGLSLVEDLLNSLCDEIKSTSSNIPEMSKKPLPYIDKSLSWLIKSIGLKITLDEQLLNDIKTIRKVRNRYIHQISKDLPDNIRNSINEIIGKYESEKILSESFIEYSLTTLAELVKTIEISYIEFYHEHNPKK